ncbi:TetR family transcriptional regulator C-terminal domain-containing protein [Pseudotenacibaculum sp. MALMAid0570]|uniref:TetR/AcrR family transcriptional regulator n=1 Tax=Pseudotenacibaculum sp. MALMAid0570 TaxID=3143938 RepID=UPI0032DFE4D4
MKRKIFREDILNAGQELMFLNGYNATGIKQITDHVQIPKGSFYNHFENKESFALEVLKIYCERGISNHRRALLTDTSISPVKRIKDMYTRLIGFYVEKGDFDRGCMMSNFSAEMADISKPFRDLLEEEFLEIQSIITSVLEEAKQKGELSKDTDTDSTASFILNSWHGALVRMKAAATNKPLKDFQNLIFNKILI